MNPAFVLVLVCALGDWYAVARQNKTLEYLLKPATMLVLIVVTVLLSELPPTWQRQWFIAGFFLSLLGDIFLMLPNPRGFLPGLGAFLLAHVCYIVGLNPTLPPPASLLLLVPIVVVVGLVVRRVIFALRDSNHDSLIAPVLGYGTAMTLMVLSAWATLLRPDWSDPRRAFVILGATSFLISDALLAWNRFVQPIAPAKVVIMVTYHLGQILLALSIR